MVEQRNEGGDAIHPEMAQVPHGKLDERTVYWFDNYELEERGLDVNQWQAPDEGQLLALCDLPTTWMHPASVGMSTTRRTLYIQPLEQGLWRLWRKEWQFGSDDTVRSFEDATKVSGGALVLSACCTAKEGDSPTKVGMFLLREWIYPTKDENAEEDKDDVYAGLVCGEASPYHSIKPKLLSLNQIYSVLFSVYFNVYNRWNQPTFTKDDFDAILRETPLRLTGKVRASIGSLDSSYRVRNWMDDDSDGPFYDDEDDDEADEEE